MMVSEGGRGVAGKRLHKSVVGLKTRLMGGLGQGATSAFAALLAYLPNLALGSGEGFWGAITAIAVAQTDFKASRTIARDQFAGAAVGGAIGLCSAVALGQHIWSYALAVMASMLICWAADVPSASRLSGVTATILLLVPHTGSVQSMALSRVSEVAWGVCVAVATVWSIERVSGAIVRARRGVPPG